MDPKRKNLTTELKDLDVDRVDGVDRPATGRAFALFKSASQPVISKTVGTTKAKDIVVKSMADVRALAHDIAKGVVNLAGIRVFTESGNELSGDAITSLLTSTAGDGSRSEEMFSPAGQPSFPAGGAKIVDRNADVEGVRPPANPYNFTEPDPWYRVGESFMPAGDPNIAPPGQYTAPAPGSMAQVDAPQPDDSMRDPHTGRVLPVKKGTFSGTETDMFAPVAQAMETIQKSKSALPMILKAAIVNLIHKTEGGFVVRCEGETSPTFKSRLGAMEFVVAEIAKAMNVSDEELKAALAALDDDATFRRECAEGSVQGALRRAQARELGIMKHGLLDGKRITSTPTTKRSRIV